MKTILSNKAVDILVNVNITLKGRTVIVEKLQSHQCKTQPPGKNKERIRIDKLLGNRKELATVPTVCSHVLTVIKVVTLGFRYKMRSVYTHFPRQWSMLLFQRMFLLLKSEVYWVKIRFSEFE